LGSATADNLVLLLSINEEINSLVLLESVGRSQPSFFFPYWQPEDYEPPFFKCCADNEAINIWNKNPLKMEVGNVNSKHLVLALKVKGNEAEGPSTFIFELKMMLLTVCSPVKVKSVLDPCDDDNVNSGDDGMTVDNESDHDDDFSDTEVKNKQINAMIYY
jgi:hypothetical protein